MALNAGNTGNTVTVEDNDLIFVTLRGPQSGETIKTLRETLTREGALLHAQGRKVRILIDVVALKFADANSSSRIEGRKLLAELLFDAMGIVGSTQLLTLAMYLTRIARPGLNVRYFKHRSDARAWLRNEKKPKTARPISGIVFGVAIIIIGVLALLGWQFSNAYLRGFLPNLRPMNPVAAVGLLAVGYGFICYWRGTLGQLRITGACGVVLGVAALLPLHINYLLYGDRLTKIGPHTHIAQSAAICLVLMGIVGLIARRRDRWVRPAEYAAAGVIGVLALVNIFGQLYAHDFIYSLSNNFVMALNLAVAFAIAAAGIVVLALNRDVGNVLGRVTRIGWLFFAALLFIQIATYGMWNEAIIRNENASQQAFTKQAGDLADIVKEQIRGYSEVLYGFRGFFLSSTYVSQGDFNTYYKSLDLATNLPGLRSMSFISAVKTKDLPAFVRLRQQDNTLYPGGNPTFAIHSQTSAPLHYIATYSSDPNSQSSLGLDVTSIPGRTDVYNSAIALNSSFASDTVTFLKTATTPAEKGFFITIPVRSEAEQNNLGVVNVSFNYATFFPTLFNQRGLQNLNVVVKEDDGGTIYQFKNTHGDLTLATTLTVPIVNNNWHMYLQAPNNFGLSKTQTYLPLIILVSGQVLSVLFLAIFLVQLRGRRQALELADSATIDLQSERNNVLEQHEKDEAILGGIGEGLIVFNRHGNVERVNAAAQRFLGYDETELVGKNFSNVLVATNSETGHEIPRAKRPAAQALEGHKAIATKMSYTRKNGQRFPVDLNVAPVSLGGKVIGAIEVFRDITHEYELDKAKSEFVSLASHQLRTPLSAINWYAEMLVNGDAGKLKKEQAEYLREIYEGNQRMVELVNSLLDVSRLELGRMANQPVPTDMSEVVESIEKELTTAIVGKKLAFSKYITPHMAPVIGDSKQLRMIVQNLLSNATKYTPVKGSVKVVLRRATVKEVLHAGLPHERPYLFFSVQDNGYGIPEEQAVHIFEKLFRANNVRKLDVEGTGLGLYIVKKVVESMGGRVWFDSVENIGTTFYVVLPFKTTKQKGIT